VFIAINNWRNTKRTTYKQRKACIVAKLLHIFSNVLPIKHNRLRARNTFAPPRAFSESPMSGEYFGRLIALASGAFVCYLAVKYVTLKIKIVLSLSLHIKYMMFFGVTVHEID